MTSGVEKAKGDAAVNTAADENGDPEPLSVRYGAREIRLEISIRDGGRSSRDWSSRGDRGTKRPDEGSGRLRETRVRPLGREKGETGFP